MRILDRYICREVFSHALLGLGVFTFVLFVPQLVRLMELAVRHSADAATVALLFLCTLPGVFTFTIPMAVLVGVLIGLGRMSADSEVIALHALGVGLRRLLVPIGLLALGTAALTLAFTAWLGPASIRKFRALEERLRTTQASVQVHPRVFDERFPRLVVYVQDVEAAATRWRGIFLAESGAESGSRLTLAEEAIVIADRQQGKIQLSLRNGSTHEYSRREPDRYSVSTFGESDVTVTVSTSAGPAARQPTNAERSLGELLTVSGPRWRDARAEFHRRLALPAACLIFALLGVPVGARPRRGGRAGGFLITLLLIFGYYLVLITGAGMARQGSLPPGLGIWAANLLALLLGLSLLPRMEQVQGEGLLARWAEVAADWRRNLRRSPAQSGSDSSSRALHPGHPATKLAEVVPITPPHPRALRGARRSREAGFPLLMDLYILRNFFHYFLLMIAGFLLLFDSFTFFELLDDVARNNIRFAVVADYFRYLAPHLLYQLLPLAALVAVLVTLGAMSKRNEITAFQASGISLYRLSVPLLVVGGGLALAMLVLDDTYLPYANQKQDALRNQIKGRPAQTFYQPRRQWIFGENYKLYNYALFDPDRKLFGGLNVFVLDPATFQMRRRVYAARAHWEEHLKTWLLEEGWVRDFDGASVTPYVPFDGITLAELTEPPAYFNREVRQHYQMDWRELRQYIRDLEQAGFDVARLSVQWHRKFAFPLLAPIVLLLGIPFTFLVGTRGALSGVALALAIAIGYYFTSELFTAMGNVGQLPPFLAAWAPDTIFAFLGLYFFLKMPT